MDPLTPTTSTLTPAISHVGSLASSIAEALRAEASIPGTESLDPQRHVVLWVLDTPARLQDTISRGHVNEARQDWAQVQEILKTWEAVDGVSELRAQCETVMQQPLQMQQSVR